MINFTKSQNILTYFILIHLFLTLRILMKRILNFFKLFLRFLFGNINLYHKLINWYPVIQFILTKYYVFKKIFKIITYNWFNTI